MRLFNKIKYYFEKKVVVLMYHRIADMRSDPWGLSVSPEHFRQHLEVLQKDYEVIPITELVEQLSANRIRRNAVCITFDDGYADNYFYAKPTLEAAQLPASFFIPTQYTGATLPFWWDELESIIMYAAELPGELSIRIGDELYYFHVGQPVLTAADIVKQNAWRYPEPPPTERVALFFSIWEKIKQCSFEDMLTAMNAIREWAHHSGITDKNNIPMDETQLRQLSAVPFFQIGLHTHTHPALSAHSIAVQQAETSTNKAFLKKYTEQYIDMMAYPSGDFNEDTFSVMASENIQACFSTEAEAVTRYSQINCLGRFQVYNWDAIQFSAQLRQWFN